MDYKEKLKYQFGGVQFPEYESMFVDLGRKETAETLANRYTTNKAEYDNLQRAMGSVQTLEGDTYTVQDLGGRVGNTMSNVVDSGAYEFGSMAVSDSVTDFMTDKKVLNAVESWQNRQKELEVIAQRRANGLQSYDFGEKPVIDPVTGLAMRDPKTGEVITEHVTDTHVTETQGVYQPLSENKLPAEEKARQLMQGIADDPILLQQVAANLNLPVEQAMFMLQSGSAVSGNKIRKVAEAVLPLYMDSAEGLQKMRALQQLSVNDATGTLYDTQEAQQVLFQDLISAAAPQRGSKLQYMQSPYMKALADQETPTSTPVEPRQSVDIDKEIENPDFDDYFNSDGSSKGYETDYGQDASYQEWLGTEEGQEMIRNERPLYANDEEFYKAKGIVTPEYSLKRVKKQLAEGKDLLNIRGNMTGKLQYLREEYANVVPRLPGQTDREYSEELWNGIVQNPAIQIGTVYSPRIEGIESMKKVLGNSPSLQVIDINNPTNNPLTLNEWGDKIADERNDTWNPFNGKFWDLDEDWQKEIITALQGGDTDATVQINGLTARGPLAGGIEITYTPADGSDPFNLIVGDKSKPLAEFKRLGAVSDLIAQGKPNASKTINYPKPTKTGDPITDGKMPNGITHIDYTYKVRRNPNHGNIESYVLIEYKNSRTNQVYKAVQRPETLGAVVQGILDNSAARGEELGLLFGGTKPKGTTTF